MTSFFAGLFRRTRSGQTGLHVEKLEPRHQCAVEVTQDGNYIVIDGTPDADSLDIQRRPGDAGNVYDDKVLVTWTSGGVRQSQEFALYKYVERGNERFAVKNVEYLEVSGGRGKYRFWNQTRLTSYFNEAAEVSQAREVIFSEGAESLWAHRRAS